MAGKGEVEGRNEKCEERTKEGRRGMETGMGAKEEDEERKRMKNEEGRKRRKE